MFRLSIVVIILLILVQTFTKSKKTLLFLPIFFSALIIITLFLKMDFGILTKSYILFLTILLGIYIYKAYKLNLNNVHN